jgi:hypothetical protein
MHKPLGAGTGRELRPPALHTLSPSKEAQRPAVYCNQETRCKQDQCNPKGPIPCSLMILEVARDNEEQPSNQWTPIPRTTSRTFHLPAFPYANTCFSGARCRPWGFSDLRGPLRLSGPRRTYHTTGFLDYVTNEPKTSAKDIEIKAYRTKHQNYPKDESVLALAGRPLETALVQAVVSWKPRKEPGTRGSVCSRRPARWLPAWLPDLIYRALLHQFGHWPSRVSLSVVVSRSGGGGVGQV